MRLSPNELVALLVATSFAAGLNVYATIATLGLLAHFNCLLLPASLQLLDNCWIIVASALVFVIEFFADKVPAFDLIWNALHTFIRVPIAAMLAYAATSQLSPEKQLLATLVGGLIAVAAHGGKTAVRAAVTPSPEPISNISLSFGEDALAIFLTWVATQHPYSARGDCDWAVGDNHHADPLGSTLSEGIIPWCGARVYTLIDSASVHALGVEGVHPVGTIPYFRSRNCRNARRVPRWSSGRKQGGQEYAASLQHRSPALQ